MSEWNPALYAVFETERTRPAAELLARVPLESPLRVVDLGCGPGNSTELLQRRYGGARIVGTDTSQAMLAAARERLPGVAFEQSDIGDWSPAGLVDLVYADASLQWVPDHERLFPRLLSALAPGGAPELQPLYLAEFQRRVDAAYPVRADGKLLLAFPRLFIVARKT